MVAVDGVPNSLIGVRLGADEQVDRAALARGAAGAIKIPEASVLITWNEVKAFLASQQQLGLPPHRPATGKFLPTITAGPDLIKALANAMGKESADLTSPARHQLKPMQISASADVRLRVARRKHRAQHVVGILEAGMGSSKTSTWSLALTTIT